MQNVNFNSIDDFFEFLPAKELKVVEYLRKIILDCIPNCTEKLAYNVLYFKLHSNICFLWPASILWGKKQTYQGVRFGFTKGYLMFDDINYLEKGDRKQVYWRDFKSIKEIDVNVLKAYIYDAVLVDEEQYKLKKNKKTKTKNYD